MSENLPAWQVISYLFASYAFGSIPTAYLATRWLKGVDIRHYGSGSVGGSNAGEVIGRWAMVVVGIIDILKAVLPTWLALYGLDLGYPMAVAAGLCALIGHNWSIYLNFYGGRGIGTIVGTLLVVFPVGVFVLLLSMLVGWLVRNTAGSTVGLLMLPVASLLLDKPAAVSWGCVGMILITAIKRLEANRAPLPEDSERWGVIWRRLWFDRDIADHKKWLSRRPGENQHAVLVRDESPEK